MEHRPHATDDPQGWLDQPMAGHFHFLLFIPGHEGGEGAKQIGFLGERDGGGFFVLRHKGDESLLAPAEARPGFRDWRKIEFKSDGSVAVVAGQQREALRPSSPRRAEADEMDLSGIEIGNGRRGDLPAGGRLEIHQHRLAEGAPQTRDHGGHVIGRVEGVEGAALLANQVQQQ